MAERADVTGSAHVFVGSAADLTDALDVAGDDGHHLARVLRLRVGGARHRGRRDRPVAAPTGSPRSARRAPRRPPAGLEQEPVPGTPGLAVAFALTKGDKPELVVQKLTELGVDRIVPVLAERSVARPDASRAEVALARWRRVALEAARQCRRATLPRVEELQPLSDLAGHPGLVVAERGGRPADALDAPRR